MSRAQRRILIGICALAAALRLTAFFALGRLTQPDVWESETIATNLLEGFGFVYPYLGTTYRSYMEPLYPGFSALVYAWTGHSTLALGVMQVLLGTGLVWLVFACGRRISSAGPGLVAAFLAAVHPGLIVYTTKFHPFVLDALLLLAVLWACLAYRAERPWRSAIGLGVLVGLCTLTRPTILVCLPIIGWWVWRGSARRDRFLQVAGLAGAALLVVSPWVVRNYQVQHRVMLTRSGTPFVFWLGNNPYRFTGSALTPSGEAVISVVPQEVRDRLQGLDELRQQDLFRQEALAHVRAHPIAFLGRWAVKVWYFWWGSPQAGLAYPAAGFRLYQTYYVVMLALALVGLATAGRMPSGRPDGRTRAWLVMGFCGLIALVQGLYYVEGRHRLAIEPFLLLLSGMGLWSLAEPRLAGWLMPPRRVPELRP